MGAGQVHHQLFQPRIFLPQLFCYLRIAYLHPPYLAFHVPRSVQLLTLSKCQIMLRFVRIQESRSDCSGFAVREAAVTFEDNVIGGADFVEEGHGWVLLATQRPSRARWCGQGNYKYRTVKSAPVRRTQLMQPISQGDWAVDALHPVAT